MRPSQEKNSLASTNDLGPFICGFVWTQKEKGNLEIDLTSDFLQIDQQILILWNIFFVYQLCIQSDISNTFD